MAPCRKSNASPPDQTTLQTQNPLTLGGSTPYDDAHDHTGTANTLNKQQILENLKAGKIGVDEATKLLEQATEPRRGLYCKVSGKGGVSVYGLQRMPVTLYVEQWERLLSYADELKAFIAEHEDELKRKDKSLP